MLPDPASSTEAGLCAACKQLSPDGRGHTFLVPRRRDGAPGYFCCLDCRALWFPETTTGGRKWTFLGLEEREADDS